MFTFISKVELSTGQLPDYNNVWAQLLLGTFCILAKLHLPNFPDYSSKRCFANNTWEVQTEYNTCSIAPRLLRRYVFYIVVLGISIVACLPAVLIFCFYKKLRITRVALHRNLLIAIVIRNALVIVSRSAVSEAQLD